MCLFSRISGIKLLLHECFLCYFVIAFRDIKSRGCSLYDDTIKIKTFLCWDISLALMPFHMSNVQVNVQKQIANNIVYSSHHHRRCCPPSIQYLSVNRDARVSRCTSYTRCGPTPPPPPPTVQCWAGVAGHRWFNAGQSSSTLAQH